MKEFFIAMKMITFILIISGSTLQAGVTGRVKGKVIDKESREPVAGATIRIENTLFETTTDDQGEFFFIAVDAGTYTVTCILNSTETHAITETTVFPDQVAELTFEVKSGSSEGAEHGNRYDNSALQLKTPFTVNTSIRSEFSKLPVRSIDDIILNSTASIYRRNERSAINGNLYNSYNYFPSYTNYEGFSEFKEAAVTGMDNLHVRGGTDNELGYYMDGLLLNDPFTGNIFLQLPFYAIDHVALQTGGFGASNGNFASGIASITPRRAGDHISVSGQYTTDAAAGLLGANDYGNRLYSATVSGPIIPKRLKFFVAADLSETNDAEPSYLGASRYRLTTGGIRNPDPAIEDTVIFKNRRKGPRPFDVNAQSVRNLYASLSYNPSPSIEIDASALHSFRKRNVFFTEYLLAPDRVPHQERSTYSIGLSGKWIVSPDLFFRAGISYYSTDYELMERSLFNKSSDGVLLLSQRTRGNTNASTYYGDNLLYDINRGFARYLKNGSDYVSLNASGGWRFEKDHFFEAGFEHRKHTMRYACIFDAGYPVGGSNNIYGYEIDTAGSKYRLKPIGSSGLDGAKTPSVTSLYLQDRFDYNIFHFTGGFRYEIFDPGTRVLKNLGNPTGNDQMLDENDFKAGKGKAYISPRFGASVEALPGLSLRGNYGLYYQTANYQQYYVSRDFLERMSIAPPYFAAVGNSSLKPTETEAYEIGANYVYKDLIWLSISHYWNTGSNIPAVIPITSLPNGLYTTVNINKSEIEGWDFILESHITRNLGAIFHMGLVDNEGDYYIENSGFRAAWLGYDEVHYVAAPRFLKSSNFSVQVNYRLFKNEGLSIGTIRPLENMSFDAIYSETSGSLYTPTEITRYAVAGAQSPRAVARQNSARIPSRQNVDVKITKDFTVSNKYRMSAFVVVTNLFDTKNAVNVFSATGLPNNDGFLGTYASGSMTEREIQQYEAILKDNFNLEPPRQVEFGLTLEF